MHLTFQLSKELPKGQDSESPVLEHSQNLAYHWEQRWQFGVVCSHHQIPRAWLSVTWSRKFSLWRISRQRKRTLKHKPTLRFYRRLPKGLVSFWSVSECWWEIRKSRGLGAAENSKRKKKKKELSSLLLLQRIHSRAGRHGNKDYVLLKKKPENPFHQEFICVNLDKIWPQKRYERLGKALTGLIGRRLSLYEASPQNWGKWPFFQMRKHQCKVSRKMKKQENIVQTKEQQ